MEVLNLGLSDSENKGGIRLYMIWVLRPLKYLCFSNPFFQLGNSVS